MVDKILLDEVLHDVKRYVMKIDIEAAECRALQSQAFWDNPPQALTMEWGNLKNNKELCPQILYNTLVKNISTVYGTNLQNFNGWDSPNLIRVGNEHSN